VAGPSFAGGEMIRPARRSGSPRRPLQLQNIHTTPEHFVSAIRVFISPHSRATPPGLYSDGPPSPDCLSREKLGSSSAMDVAAGHRHAFEGMCRCWSRIACRLQGFPRSQDERSSSRRIQGTSRARSLVIASGGLSIPKIGPRIFGYSIARHRTARCSKRGRLWFR